jgi:hypothetical protein
MMTTDDSVSVAEVTTQQNHDNIRVQWIDVSSYQCRTTVGLFLTGRVAMIRKIMIF